MGGKRGDGIEWRADFGEQVVACTDPRVTPEEFLGMGDGASEYFYLILH